MPPSRLLAPLPQRIAAAVRVFSLITNDVGERGLGNFSRKVGNVARSIRSPLSQRLLRACDERAILQRHPKHREIRVVMRGPVQWIAS